MKLSFYFDHPQFSWLINKNPENVYSQSLNNKFDIHGSFFNQTYLVDIIPNNETFIKYAKDENLDKYLLKEKYIVSPLNLIVFEKLFKEPMRSKFSIEYDNIPRNFKLVLYPIIIYNNESFISLFKDNFSEIVVEIIENKEFNVDESLPHVCKIILSGKEQIDLLLQKVFILLMMYTQKVISKKLRPNHEQLDKFILLTNKWLTPESNSYNFIVSRGGGNKYGSSYIRNSGEVVEQKFVTNLSKQRYKKVVNSIPDGAKILELGCNNGRLAMEILRSKPKIESYIGLDASQRSITKAKEKLKRSKCKFFESNFLYMDHFYWDNSNFIILSEVLEHLDKTDRYATINFLVNNLENRTLIITVPNISVNEQYWGIVDKFRHNDHRVEYTSELLTEEIIEPFINSNFVVDKICISDEMFFFEDQISFMLVIKK